MPQGWPLAVWPVGVDMLYSLQISSCVWIVGLSKRAYYTNGKILGNKKKFFRGKACINEFNIGLEFEIAG